jgi:hypothetical protein
LSFRRKPESIKSQIEKSDFFIFTDSKDFDAARQAGLKLNRICCGKDRAGSGQTDESLKFNY